MNIDTIIENGYCVGCGACVSSQDQSSEIELDQMGMYKPLLLHSGSDRANALEICPFSDNGENEDGIAKKKFELVGSEYDEKIGYYNSLYVGHVSSGAFREKGTSGGVISWVLAKLLEQGMVDRVIHVKRADRTKDGCLFKYDISSNLIEILDGAKSRYYPVEISQVMDFVRQVSGRYAFVGLPCMVKAVRKLMDVDSIINERVLFCVGLVCGHMKSTSFADSFAWQSGISPKGLEEIDFRVKLEGRSAGDYGVYVRGQGINSTRPTRSYFGYNWGFNFFRNPACNYCDDVFAETADIVVGDAWLPDYINDSKGNSVVVVRDECIADIIKESISSKEVAFNKASVEEIAQSQAGGLRDRREGLAYRLYLKHQAGEWCPKKRVNPSNSISSKRRRIYDLRMKMGGLSHQVYMDAIEQRDFSVFRRTMAIYIRKYNSYYRIRYNKMIAVLKNTVSNPLYLPKKLFAKLLCLYSSL